MEQWKKDMISTIDALENITLNKDKFREEDIKAYYNNLRNFFFEVKTEEYVKLFYEDVEQGKMNFLAFKEACERNNQYVYTDEALKWLYDNGITSQDEVAKWEEFDIYSLKDYFYDEYPKEDLAINCDFNADDIYYLEDENELYERELLKYVEYNYPMVEFFDGYLVKVRS